MNVFLNKKYWIVAALFVFLFVFGKNVVGIEGPVTKFEDNPFYGGEYYIESRGSSVTLNNIIESRSDEYYRLIFWARGESDEEVDKEVAVNIGAIGETKEIGKVMVGKSYQPHELVFKTDKRYNDLVFKKNPFNGAELFLKSIQLTSLELENDEEMNRLKSSKIGFYDDSASYPKLSSSGYQSFFDFTRKNQLFGQVFKSESDYISSVSLDLRFIGNGGAGDYQLSLRQANPVDDSFEVSDEVLATYNFGKNSATSLAERKNVTRFRFPLPAKVERGKYYFVGVKNSANFNILNHLQFGGLEDGRYSDGLAGLVKANGTVEERGDLAFEIYSAVSSDNNLNSGAIVEDIGKGNLVYSYVFDDKNYMDTLFKSCEDESCVYSFNLSKPSQSLLLDASLIGEYPLLDYSFDKDKWVNINKTNTDLRLGRSDFYKNIDSVGDVFYLRMQKGALIEKLLIRARLYD